MLAELLESRTWLPDRVAVCSSLSSVTWQELFDEFTQWRQELAVDSGCRIGLMISATARSFAQLAAIESVGANVVLLDATLSSESVNDVARSLRLSSIVSDEGRQPIATQVAARTAKPASGTVILLTSGTTGRSKAIEHTWTSLTRPIRRFSPQSPQCWLLVYRPHLYAGIQVALQSLVNGGTVVVPAITETPTDVAELMRKHAVQFASATPSYWRRLLLWAPRDVLSQVPLRQITLGGEVVDQLILDQLTALFPQARLVHIYATTEVGRCFSVTDRREGFPVAFCDRVSADGIELKVVDGQLFVRSANRMRAYDQPVDESTSAQWSTDGWFATGDLVKQQQDRWIFAGRSTELINVGGVKVSPVEVESVIRQLASVREVRVYAQQSSLAGQLVACQVVAAAGVDEQGLPSQVREHCQHHLNRYQLPRIVEVVEKLELSQAGKMKR